MISRSLLSKLGLLLAYNLWFGLYAADSYSYLLWLSPCNDAIGTTCCQRGNSYS